MKSSWLGVMLALAVLHRRQSRLNWCTAITAGAMAAFFLAVGCTHDLEAVTSPCDEAGVCEAGSAVDLDHGVRDGAAPDLPAPDSAAPDLPAPDSAAPDLPLPDLAVPDSATPDMAAPDLPAPDLPVPDLTVPDLTAPDSILPDSSIPDMAPKAWPFGNDGVLKVGLSYGFPVVKIKPGQIKDYSGIIIDSGGVLEIETGSKWVIIGVNGNVQIDGKIVARNGNHTGGTSTVNLPDNKGGPGTVSHAVVQQQGGAGGLISKVVYGAGKAAFGNGGGGASYSGHGSAATATQGGRGGNSGATKGGLGGASCGAAGKPGIKGLTNAGPGGGGGFRGCHGQAVLLQVRGNVSGTGEIDLSGGAGGAGGAGGDGNWGGGGGGGGAGGAGGRLIIKLTGKMSLSASKIKFGGVVGGKGGSGGKAARASSGSPGKQGQTGAAGQSQIVVWK